MKSCNRICDVANDGICMGVCAMGLNTQGYRVAYQNNNVYLLHTTLDGSLTQFPQSDTDKHDRLVQFVKQQQAM